MSFSSMFLFCIVMVGSEELQSENIVNLVYDFDLVCHGHVVRSRSVCSIAMKTNSMMQNRIHRVPDGVAKSR